MVDTTVDFADGEGVVLNENQAVSELEVYIITFENCLQMLKNGSPDVSIFNTLDGIKNYFINKATRKGQRMIALEEANQ